MIVRREKYYTKSKGKYPLRKTQNRKMTSYWLLGVIPLFISIEVVSGSYF